MENQRGKHLQKQPGDGLYPDHPQTVQGRKQSLFFRTALSPPRLLVTIIASIFIAEVIAMVVVRAFHFQPIPYYQITLIDAGLMTVLIFPVLYFLSFWPLLRQIEKSRQAEENLRGAYDELELRVQDRTEELRQANVELQEEITERKRAEVALREAADRFRIVADFTYDWEYWRSPQNHFHYISPSCERITGYSRKAFYDDPGLFLRIVHPDDRERLAAHQHEDFFTDQAYEIEFRIIRQDGQERWIGHACQLVLDDQGQGLGRRASNRDITARKRAEEALRQSEEKFSLAFANNPAAIALTRLDDGLILDVNDTWLALNGYSRGEVVGLSARNLPIWRTPEAATHFIEELREKGSLHRWEQEFLKKSGEVFVAQLSAQLLTVHDQTLILSTLVDITERKRIEEALRKAHEELELRVQQRTKELADANRELLNEINERKEVERQLRVETTALESAANGVIITGRRGNIRWANPAFLSMTGYSLDEVLGQNPRLLKSGRHDKDFYDCLWDTVLSGNVWRGEIVNRRKDGSLYVEEQTITPLVDESGQISNFIAIKQDVSERKQAEAELERRNLELQALSTNEHKQRQLAETLRASAQALSQSLDLDAVIRTLMKHARSLVHSDTASVILVESEFLLNVRAIEGYEQWINSNLVLPFQVDGENNPFYQKLIATRKSLLLPDTAKEPNWETYPGTEQIRNWLFTPIMTEEKILGVIALGKLETNYFTGEHIQWTEALVGQAAVAIQNAWLFEQIRAGRARLQSLSRRLVEIQETERRFIARELHDHAGQTLTSLILGLGALEREADNTQNVRTRAAELKSMTDNVLEDLHRLAIKLRPASLDHLGLVPALEQLIKSFTHSTTLRIRFKAVGICEDDRLPQEMETSLYRIAQEALTNVIRHAGARHADVVVEQRGDMARILIEDDGKGFDMEHPETGGHLGLLGMQERAQMLGGKLTVESVPGKGTTLVVEVPFANSNHTSR